MFLQYCDSAIIQLSLNYLFFSLNQLLAKKEAELDLAVKEKVAEELIRKEKSVELADLEERFREEQEKVIKMQKTVESARVEARKQGVLSLEIQNYEVSHNLIIITI